MDYKKAVLRKLFSRHAIGGRHTAIENIVRGVPKHAIGHMKDAADELIREGFILPKQTHYGLQVSLNPERMQEIKSIIKE